VEVNDLALSIIDLLPDSASKNTGKIIFEDEDITNGSQVSMRIRGKKISYLYKMHLRHLTLFFQ